MSDTGPALTQHERIELYRWMRLTRAFDDRMVAMWKQGRGIGGTFSGRGHEAISVGAGMALAPNDVVAPMHRGLGCYLVRGLTPERISRNLLGRATGLDRNELGMFLVQAGLAGGRDHALACLLALNGLRVSEALNANIEHLGLERGHRTLTILRKGGKIATIPLAPRTARAVDLCVGERNEGPILRNHDGTRRLDRHAATRIVKRLARKAGIDKTISPHSRRRHGRS